VLLFAAVFGGGCKKPKASKLRVVDTAPAAVVGAQAACFFGTDGGVRCSGVGPLPDGAPASDRAGLVPALQGADDIAMSLTVGCARFAQEARCWGDNTAGLIAPGGAKQVASPTQVASGIKDMAVLPSGLCVLSVEGRLRCRGAVPGQPSVPANDWYDFTPDVLTRIHVAPRVMCAQGALTDPLRCWGASHPRPLGDRAAVAVSCGDTHCLAHTRAGEAFEWNVGDPGQVARALPVPPVQGVAASRCVVLKGGQVICATETNGWERAAPLPGLFGVAQIACGAAGTLFVTRAGGAYAYGPNTGYALGVFASPLTVPMPVFVRL